jgi:hypothetical protein
MKGRRYKYKIRIILSTSEGKYIVKKSIKHWIPVGEIFKNHLTGWIIPYSVKYKDKFVGSNVKYILLLKYQDREQTIHLYERDYELRLFDNFIFTKESLENKDKLIKYIQEKVNQGKLLCKSFEVIEPSEWRKEIHQEIIAPVFNRFQYYVLGRISTYLSNRKLKKDNNKLANSRKKQASK